MGFDVMSLNDPFIEVYGRVRVNNDDGISKRSEANIGQLKSLSSKCATKRRGMKNSFLDPSDPIMHE